MTWFIIAAPLLYILGVLVRDGHFWPETRWVPIGNFLIYLSYAIFIVMVIVSIVGVFL